MSIYSELSNKYQLPSQVIKVICNHPFMFANRRITEGDERPMLFTYLGKIKIKKVYEGKKEDTDNKDTTKRHSNRISRAHDILQNVLSNRSER